MWVRWREMCFDNVWMPGEMTREGRREHLRVHMGEDGGISDG